MDFSLSFKQILGAFMVLFAIIDITGAIPVLLELKQKGNKINALSAVIGSFILFVVFLFAGEKLLNLFGVDIESFAVAGSIIILALAIEMILGVELMKNDGPGVSSKIVPIIFTLIAGAGKLTT